MISRDSIRNRTEQLIAAGRFLFSVALVALVLPDPDLIVSHVLVSSFSVFYVLGAFTVLIFANRADRSIARYAVHIHLFDLLGLALCLAVGRSIGPLAFLFFVFFVLSAALRFTWQATLANGIVVLAAVTAIVPWHITDGHARATALVAPIALAAIIALLTQLAAYLQRMQREITRLAQWPRTDPLDPKALIDEILSHAAGVLAAPRALMVWEEPEEPWVYVGHWVEGRLDWKQMAPGTFGSIVDEALAGEAFLCPDVRLKNCEVTIAGNRRISSVEVINPQLREEYDMTSVLSASLAGKTFRGRLFLLDRLHDTWEDLALGEIVANLIAARIDQFFLLKAAQQAAVHEERIRLARDLHDGVLQSLTGTALKLKAAQEALPDEPAFAQKNLEQALAVIEADQRELRTLIRQLRPRLGEGDHGLLLTNRLKYLGDRLERQWGLAADVRIDPAVLSLVEPVASEIYSVVNEAVANAAKHAHASRIQVAIDVDDGLVRVRVADDGRGFPFRGRYDLKELDEMRRGPVTLKERIAALRGDLVVDSSERGSTLEMAIPTAWSGD